MTSSFIILFFFAQFLVQFVDFLLFIPFFFPLTLFGAPSILLFLALLQICAVSIFTTFSICKFCFFKFIELHRFLLRGIYDDEKFLISAIKGKFPLITIERISQRLRNDHDFMLFLFQNYSNTVSHHFSPLLNDESFLLNAVKMDSMLFENLPVNFYTNQEFIFLAIKENPNVFFLLKSFSRDNFNGRGLIYSWSVEEWIKLIHLQPAVLSFQITNNISVISYLKANNQDIGELFTEILKKDGLAIQYLETHNLRHGFCYNQKYALIAVDQNINAIHYLHNKLKTCVPFLKLVLENFKSKCLPSKLNIKYVFKTPRFYKDLIYNSRQVINLLNDSEIRRSFYSRVTYKTLMLDYRGVKYLIHNLLSKSHYNLDLSITNKVASYLSARDIVTLTKCSLNKVTPEHSEEYHNDRYVCPIDFIPSNEVLKLVS